MRILIIEDHKPTADHLCNALKEHFFLPDVAYDGQQGLFLATNMHYDLIILDVMLPYIDGWNLVQKIRQMNLTIPILFLTARDAIDDKVKGLELGADDYLVKPFAFVELLARIRTLVRRQQPQQQDTIEIVDLKINTKKYTASRAGSHLNLTAKEFMLLTLMANNKGQVLSRTHIAEQVWDINFDCDSNAIDVAIKRLRDKIDKKFSPQLIHTIRGVGYVLEVR